MNEWNMIQLWKSSSLLYVQHTDEPSGHYTKENSKQATKFLSIIYVHFGGSHQVKKDSGRWMGDVFSGVACALQGEKLGGDGLIILSTMELCAYEVVKMGNEATAHTVAECSFVQMDHDAGR